MIGVERNTDTFSRIRGEYVILRKLVFVYVKDLLNSCFVDKYTSTKVPDATTCLSQYEHVQTSLQYACTPLVQNSPSFAFWQTNHEIMVRKQLFLYVTCWNNLPRFESVTGQIYFLTSHHWLTNVGLNCTVLLVFNWNDLCWHFTVVQILPGIG